MLDEPLRGDSNSLGPALAVSSGRVNASYRVEYSLVYREVRYFPTRPLRDDLRWTLTLDSDALISLGGGRPIPLEPVAFRIDGGLVVPDGDLPPHVRLDDAPPPVAAPVRFATDVEPVLRRACGACHGVGGLVALDHATLRAASSVTLPDVPLVRPFDPAGSMLLQKVVPDHPVRFGTVMPPPWSDQAPLTHEELRVIEAWIQQGAVP